MAVAGTGSASAPATAVSTAATTREEIKRVRVCMVGLSFREWLWLVGHWATPASSLNPFRQVV